MSVNDSIDCPYCGFDHAQSNYDDESGTEKHCDICGWNHNIPRRGTERKREPSYEVLLIAKDIVSCMDEIWELDEFTNYTLFGGWIPSLIEKDGRRAIISVIMGKDQEEYN